MLFTEKRLYFINNMNASIKIFTDGGCSGNPGPGGWAYVIVSETFQGPVILAEKYGSEKETTNNRMELRAVIESLRVITLMENVSKNAVIYTDSQYVQKGITEWILKWKKNAWRTSDKKPVKNQDLWVELDTLSAGLLLKWEWIRGHSGNEFNERCDRMTQEAIWGKE